MSDLDVIWVVSSGAYSDYRVLCACPNKQEAEKVAEKLNHDPTGWNDDPRVQCLLLVSGDVEKVAVIRLTTTLWDDGRETERRQSISEVWPFDVWEEAPSCSWRWVRAPVHQDIGGRLDVWGTNHERCRKVFSEKRAQLIAEDTFRLRPEAKGRTP